MHLLFYSSNLKNVARMRSGEVRSDLRFKMVQVSDIQPNPFQPRESYDRESLKELAESIKAVGVLQPILVREHGLRYQIVAGERRWRAAQMAGERRVPCIIKETSEERVLLESLIENLHRANLNDIERENAIHEIWERREDFGIESKSELARKLSVRESKVYDDLEAYEFRSSQDLSARIPTDTIRRTRGLEPNVRRLVINKVDRGEVKASEVDTIAKVLRRAPDHLRKEVLRPRTRITPRIAEAIVERIPSEENQKKIIAETENLSLTESEIENKIRDIQHSERTARNLNQETPFEGAREVDYHVIDDYECPHCKRHYVIKCDGTKDWLEPIDRKASR